MRLQTDREVFQHELGHWIAAWHKKQRPGSIVISANQGSSETDLVPIANSLDEMRQYLEGRLIVLWSGMVAEAMMFDKRDALSDLAATTAANDHAKIRELTRVCAGIEAPSNCTDAVFQKRLDRVRKAAVRASENLIRPNLDALSAVAVELEKRFAALSRPSSWSVASAEIERLLRQHGAILDAT